MRALRLLLVVSGTGLAGYGGWLLWPRLGPVLPWLVAGPLVHDGLVAPLVGLVGLALGRRLGDRGWRTPVTAGLMASGTLLLIAIPLIWRPAAAPPNPGLQDRDYAVGLAVWLGALRTMVAAARWLAPRRPGTRRSRLGTGRRTRFRSGLIRVRRRIE